MIFHSRWRRVLERIGARALSAHLRKLCDYLAFEFTISGQNNINISKLIDAVNSLMWKYNVVTLDRLVLCLVSFYLLHRTHFLWVLINWTFRNRKHLTFFHFILNNSQIVNN